MSTSFGILSAQGQAIENQLPILWLSKPGIPATPPSWANIAILTSTQVQNLQAEISYDQSGWNYNKIGANNQLGAYQISTQNLETYGLLAAGSNAVYGNDCVNYRNCWQQVVVRNNTNSYANYLYNIQSLSGFLTNTVAQDHLAFQIIYDLYNNLVQAGAIVGTDSAETAAGMIYVGWNLGISGAFDWRYSNIGNGANYYNSGRYAIAVLSQ